MAAVDEHGGWPSLLGAVTGGRDLSRSEAEAAMADILTGAVPAAQISGLIVALRIKGETVEEMTGLVTAMQAAAERVSAPPGAIDIVGTGGSNHRRRHALNVSTMASIVAAAAGAVVCKHGNRRASSTSGSFDFLEALGVGIELDPDELESCMATTGLGFAFARTFHPAMRFVAAVRAELGIPTVFNVLGPLANPGRVTRQVVGTSSEELAAKMASVLRNLGSERAWVVAGADGFDELSVTGPTVVFDATAAGIERFVVDPAEFGIDPAPSLDAVAGGSPARNVEIFSAILSGADRGARREVVVLNAGAGLVVAGVATDLAEGLSLAGAVIDDGRAQAKLEQIRAVTGH